MVDINEYFESLPESEEVLRKQALEKIKKTFYKIHLNSLYGTGAWMITGKGIEFIDNIFKDELRK